MKLIFSLNSPCIFIILDIHEQNAQITNKVQSALLQVSHSAVYGLVKLLEVRHISL